MADPDLSSPVYPNTNELSSDPEKEPFQKNEEKSETVSARAEEEKQAQNLLSKEETVSVEIDSSGAETLPIQEKKGSRTNSNIQEQKGKIPDYFFPSTQLKSAWKDSPSLCSFVGAAVCIVFHTVGWFTCIGGLPFLSLAMLIIGSIYVHDCNIEPNIPVYLIVSGVIGTILHITSIWNKYNRKTSKGMEAYRNKFQCLDGILHLFMIIWFILGCIWVYGATEVEFRDRQKDEYCHKTVYYFAFWVLNLSFILLGLLIAISLCFIVYASSSKN